MDRKNNIELATTEITKYLEDAIDIYGKYGKIPISYFHSFIHSFIL
jgi:hypothetical protein